MSSRTNNIIGITGGIGSGKSVVSRILRLQGCLVYDCDKEAACLMDSSDEVKRLIADTISADVITDKGEINRKLLGDIVFSNEEMRRRLNNIVHGCVKTDIHTFVSGHPGETIYIESAILGESGIADFCNKIWLVEAPEDLRIDRVRVRNGISVENVKARINAQAAELDILYRYKDKIILIKNDDRHSLLSQINKIRN